MKRLLTCVLICTLCISLTACNKEKESSSASSSRSSAPRSYRVSAILASDNEYAAQVLAGAKAAISAAGADVTLTTDYADESKLRERELLDALDPKQTQGVLCLPVSSDESVARLNRVYERGIPVAIAGVSTSSTSFAVAAVAYDEYALGKTVGEQARAYIEGKLEGKAKIAVMHHNETNRIESLQRQNGFFDVLKEMKDVTAVGVLDLSTKDGAATRVTAFLKEHTDIDIIFCTTGQELAAVHEAVTTANYKAALFGVGAYREVTEILRSENNTIEAIAAQDYYQMGYSTMEALLKTMDTPGAQHEPEELTPVLLTPSNPDAIADFESKLG